MTDTPKLPTTQTETARLETLLYKFITLYERWAEDKALTQKQVVRLEGLLQDVAEQVNVMEALETEVKQRLVTGVRELLPQLGQRVEAQFQETVLKQVKATIANFERALQSAHTWVNHVEHRQQTRWHESWLIVATVAVVVGVLVGSITVRWLMPTPYLPLSATDFQRWENGRVLERVWAQLPHSERQRIKRLGKPYFQAPASTTSRDAADDGAE